MNSLLSSLRDSGFTVALVGESLSVRPTPGPSLLAVIRQHKPEILTALQVEMELFEERASILEFDAGLPREEAERQARLMLGIRDG